MRRNRFKPRHRRRGTKNRHFRKYLIQGFRIGAGLGGVFILSLALMTGYHFMTHCRYFSAATIRINGLKRLSAASVLEQAQICQGENILAVNLALARKRLLAHPWVADVDLQRRLPDVLELTVTEQTPLAVVDLGRPFVINTRGEIFKKASDQDVRALPMITGLTYADLNFSADQTETPFKAALAVLRIGRQPNSVIPNPMLKELHVDREMGLTLVAFDNPLAIRIGYANYPAKYKALSRVLSYLKREPEACQVGWIDVNNPARIVLNVKAGERSQKAEKEI